MIVRSFHLTCFVGGPPVCEFFLQAFFILRKKLLNLVGINIQLNDLFDLRESVLSHTSVCRVRRINYREVLQPLLELMESRGNPLGLGGSSRPSGQPPGGGTSKTVGTPPLTPDRRSTRLSRSTRRSPRQVLHRAHRSRGLCLSWPGSRPIAPPSVRPSSLLSSSYVDSGPFVARAVGLAPHRLQIARPLLARWLVSIDVFLERDSSVAMVLACSSTVSRNCLFSLAKLLVRLS